MAADAPSNGAPAGVNFSAPGVAWMGFIAPKEPNYAIARTFNDYSNPPSGLGPVSDGPAHPYANNEVAREMRTAPTYRVADLDNEAGKNLMPWVREALQKQNELALKERNGETREARCWETGVPAFHLNPGAMRIIQTPKEVLTIGQGDQTIRHIYLDVPHSANPKPSWYGESVGHYEGDWLVVDTIAQDTRTFIDNFRTPHSDKLHVVERYHLINGGNMLEAEVTIEDPAAFKTPVRLQMRARKAQAPDGNIESRCADGESFNPFGQKAEPIPIAAKPDF